MWSMHVRPDERVLVTGSADRDVKFWDIEEKNAGEAVGWSLCLIRKTFLQRPRRADKWL